MKVKELTEVFKDLPQESEAELLVVIGNAIYLPKKLTTSMNEDGLIRIVLSSEDIGD